MPTESEIIKIRVQDALRKLSRIEIPNIRLAAHLYNAPFKRIYNRINGIKSKIERPSSNKMLN
jgi:hypothetical protein